MVLVMHSYGSLPISLISSQEEETHIKMSTRRDLFHFSRKANLCRAGGGVAGATQGTTVLFSVHWSDLSGKIQKFQGKISTPAVMLKSPNPLWLIVQHPSWFLTLSILRGEVEKRSQGFHHDQANRNTNK